MERLQAVLSPMLLASYVLLAASAADIRYGPQPALGESSLAPMPSAGLV